MFSLLSCVGPIVTTPTAATGDVTLSVRSDTAVHDPFVSPSGSFAPRGLGSAIDAVAENRGPPIDPVRNRAQRRARKDRS